MEYPGTTLTRPIRLALLIFFITIFLISAPVLIMYTSGYRYDWQHGLLKETGSINIDIEPKTATAYLNNIRLQEKLPIRLNNITPAKYNLRLTAPGYFDWNKEIDVKNKQTNYTKEIALIKKNRPELVFAGGKPTEESEITNFSVSYDGRFIAFASKKNTFDVLLLDTTNNQTTNIVRTNSLVAPEITWSEQNYYLAITLKNNTNTYSQLHIVNANNPQQIKDIAQNNQSIHKIQWANSTEPQLYYSTAESISIYSPESDRSQLIGENTYIDWYMENGELWTMQIATPTQTYQIIKNTLGFNSVFNQISQANTDANLKILTVRDNTVLTKTDIGSSTFLITSGEVYKLPTQKFTISKYNNWWLLWSDWELWTYSQGEEPNLLNRSGEQLNQVLPLDQYNTLALAWDKKITALFPYYFVAHELFDEQIINPAVDTENKILYFINKNEGGIWKLQY